MAADGLQGSAALAANVPTLIASAQNNGTTVNVLIANNSSTTTNITIWVSFATISAGLATKDIVTPANRILVGAGEYEKNALVLSSGESVWVNDTQGVCSVQVRGFVG